MAIAEANIFPKLWITSKTSKVQGSQLSFIINVSISKNDSKNNRQQKQQKQIPKYQQQQQQ